MVANLPSPTAFKNFTPKTPIVTFEEKNYNLEDEVKKYGFSRTGTVIYFELVKMFGEKFIGRLDFQRNEVLKAVESAQVKLDSYITHYYGEYRVFYTHSSLVVKFYNEDKLMTVSIRRFRTKSGQIIKWFKVKGSKAGFIPYKLSDNYSYCFVAFGIAEALIFNILGLEYFILQSDSEAYRIANNPYFKTIKEKLEGRDLLILPDYDESGFKAAAALKNNLKSICNPQIVEFYKLVANPFKGYDFRDYVLEIQNKDLIIKNLLNLL